MPATRAGGRSQPRGFKSPGLSSSSEGDDLSLISTYPVIPSKRSSKKTRKPTSRPKSIINPDDIIEISDDDEPVPPQRSTSATASLRRQNAELQEKNKHSEEALARCQQDLLELKTTGGNDLKGKLVLDGSTIEDDLCCEICTYKMWSPYLLPDCGHTFCQTCLQDWFSSALAQHITNNPHYNLDQPNMFLISQITAALRGMIGVRNPQIHHLLVQLQSQQPRYTCPTCREPVHGRPAKNFALKALVRTVASAGGESSPKKAVNPKGKGAKQLDDPWSGFFPQLSG